MKITKYGRQCNMLLILWFITHLQWMDILLIPLSPSIHANGNRVYVAAVGRDTTYTHILVYNILCIITQYYINGSVTLAYAMSLLVCILFIATGICRLPYE